VLQGQSQDRKAQSPAVVTVSAAMRRTGRPKADYRVEAREVLERFLRSIVPVVPA
jgi:hypothetical protein